MKEALVEAKGGIYLVPLPVGGGFAIGKLIGTAGQDSDKEEREKKKEEEKGE